MSAISTVCPDDIALYIEVRGIYDGVSVYQLTDGSYVNRWPEDDPRHKPTHDWIESMKKEELP